MSSRIYVGNLPGDVRRDEIDRLFSRYGRVRAVDVKYGRDGRGPAYAFIEFDHPRDADDACRGEDQRTFGGMRMRVEASRGQRVNPASRGPPNRSSYRVRVLGLPESCSWQDLKDHMRSAGDVGYSDVNKSSGTVIGVVEYKNQGDMDEALKRLNGSEFSNRFGDKAVITVEEDRQGGGGSGSGRGGYDERPRDRSPPRDRSRSRERGHAGGDRDAPRNEEGY